MPKTESMAVLHDPKDAQPYTEQEVKDQRSKHQHACEFRTKGFITCAGHNTHVKLHSTLAKATATSSTGWTIQKIDQVRGAPHARFHCVQWIGTNTTNANHAIVRQHGTKGEKWKHSGK